MDLAPGTENQFIAVRRDRAIHVVGHDPNQSGADPAEEFIGGNGIGERKFRQFVRRDPAGFDIHAVGDLLDLRREFFIFELMPGHGISPSGYKKAPYNTGRKFASSLRQKKEQLPEPARTMALLTVPGPELYAASTRNQSLYL